MDGTLFDDFNISNGLRYGCMMALTLFNLYVSIFSQGWLRRVEGLEGVGKLLMHNFDQKLIVL